MGDISAPHSLSHADAALSIATSLQKLLDASERKKITEDVIACHALNETEAKKAQEARDLIVKNSGILEETKKMAEQTARERKILEHDRAQFKQEQEKEYAKIGEEKSKSVDALTEAKRLHADALKIQDDAEKKERDLLARESAHEGNVRKHEESERALESKRKDIERFRDQVLALDKETKEKVEKLKQFNF